MTENVVVVGSINVDLVTTVARLPGAGETVIGGSFEQTHGGKGANQAVAAARLGARVALVGMLGDDDLGRAARAELEAEGVELEQVRVGRGHTGVAQILVAERGENLIAVASGVNDELTGSMVADSFDALNVDKAVVLAVLEILDDAVFAAADAANERDWPFVLNPAPARPLTDELLARCEVITPNEHEVGALGKATPDELLEAGVSAVVVTHGARGAELYRGGQPVHRQSPFSVPVVDTTGAGDAFRAGFIAGWLRGGTDPNVHDVLRYAHGVAALNCRGLGARDGLPRHEEVEELIRRG
jgi:ribokinase